MTDLASMLQSAVMRDIRRLTLNYRHGQFETYAEYTIDSIHRGFTAKNLDAFKALQEVLLPGYEPTSAIDRDSLAALKVALDDLIAALRVL